MMGKMAGALLAAGLVLSGEAIASQGARENLVAACQREAARGHALAWRMEPSLRNMIKGQRKQMSAACAAFLAGGRGTTALLSQCLHEASQGPLHIQRGRNMDRAHVERQKDLCRALGGQTEAKRVYHPLPE